MSDLSYKKLMSHSPTVYSSVVNRLGQKIEFVEHPLRGDEYFVIAVSHEHKLAMSTDFFETDDMEDIESGYTPIVENGQLVHE